MADIYKGELQDNLGNTVYPHTEADVVFCADGKTAQEKLAGYENALGNVTGTTDSLEVDDSNVLATSKAVKAVDNKLGGLRFGYDGDSDSYGYYGADGSLIPFSSGASKITITLELSMDGGSKTTPKKVTSTIVYEKQDDDTWLCNGATSSSALTNNWTTTTSAVVYGGAKILSIVVE